MRKGGCKNRKGRKNPNKVSKCVHTVVCVNLKLTLVQVLHITKPFLPVQNVITQEVINLYYT